MGPVLSLVSPVAPTDGLGGSGRYWGCEAAARKDMTVSLLEMRDQYEQIKATWRSLPPAEHRVAVSRLQQLRSEAEESPDEGTEQLGVELDDLIAQIGHQVHRQHGTPVAPSYGESSDAM